MNVFSFNKYKKYFSSLAAGFCTKNLGSTRKIMAAVPTPLACTPMTKENQKLALQQAWRVFTSRCYAQRGYDIVSGPSVRLSVCDVQVCFSHTLEYFENNFTVD